MAAKRKRAFVVHFYDAANLAGTRCGREPKTASATTAWEHVTCGHCKMYGPETFESIAAAEK